MYRWLRALLTPAILISTIILIPSAHAIDYTVTYNANETQHQAGVTSGSVPNSITQASGTTVTVSANSGSLARQGFTFAGWNTLANGSGTTFAAGTGTFPLTGNTTLYAKWEIPAAARMIGAGGSIVVFSNPNNVLNGGYCTDSNVRGITSDGTYIYFRPSQHLGYICKVNLAGEAVSVSSNIATLAGMSGDSLALTYSAGCIFIRDTGVSSTANIYCIDPTDWSMTLRTLPQNLAAGSTWLYGNLIDFPDGRIGSVSAPGQSLTVGTGAGQCPSGMYCKVLKLFTLSGTGKAVTATFSENIILADSINSWPGDEHGIATDGTYLYEINHANGYKVWALRSGAPSYLVFNADISAAGSCGASTGISQTYCKITYPVNGLAGGGAMTNATFIGHGHLNGMYFMGDYDAKQFYKTIAAFPPAGPGTPSSSFNSFALAGSVTTVNYRTPIVITANVSVASKVTFKLENNRIPNCTNVKTTGSTPNIVATCTWKPSRRGPFTLSAVATPNTALSSQSSSSSIKVFVDRRIGTR